MSADVYTLRPILEDAVKMNASDVHLKETRPPAYRVDGKLRFRDKPALTNEDMHRFLDEILTADEKDTFLAQGDMDYAYAVSGLGRFRVNCYKQRGTLAIVMRHVKTRIPTFEELHLPVKQMETIAGLARGLVLVTGPASMGKSSTLAALINYINTHREAHIVTLEDPIEFLHADKRSSISQREVGIDTKDFKVGLRAILREDPNVILIGEMRDLETFRTCLGASETGHLVFSTLHTSNVMMTFDRILDMFPSDEHEHVRSQLALQVRAIMSQRLVPTANGTGRIPAVEILFTNPGVATLIREDEFEQIPTAIAGGAAQGMQTFNMSLVKFVQEKLITQEAAEWASDNPDELRMNLQGIHISRERGGILRKPR